MRKFCLILIVGWASLTGATVFTANVNGNWNAGSTWNGDGTTNCHTGIPCMTDASNAGDTVIMNAKTVTCPVSVTCSVGTSPSSITMSACTNAGGSMIDASTNGAHLIVQGTFVWAGPICWAAFTGGTQIIEIQDGARLQHDSSWATTPVGYIWEDSFSSAASTAQWLIGTAAGSGATIDGDSFNSTKKCTAGACATNCPSALTAGCIQTSMGANGGTSPNEGGSVKAYNSTFQNMGGAGNAWGVKVINLRDTIFRHCRFINDSEIDFSTTGSASIIFDRNYMTAGKQASGHYILWVGSALATGVGRQIYTNNWFEGGHTASSGQAGMVHIGDVKKTTWCVGLAAGTGCVVGSSNYNPGDGNYFGGPHYQVFDMNDTWNTGNVELSGGPYMNIAIVLWDSVTWMDKNYTSGQHHHVFSAGFSNPPDQNLFRVNDVIGGIGGLDPNPQSGGWQNGAATGGTGLNSSQTFTAYGDIELCGIYGQSSSTAFDHWWSANTLNWSARAVQIYQTTNCSNLPQITSTANTVQVGGYSGGEYNGSGGAWASPGLIDNNAGLYFRADSQGPGLGDVAVIGDYSGCCDSTYTANPPWHSINYNAVINMRTASATTAPCQIRTTTQAANTCNWAQSGGSPTTTTEIMIPAINPTMIDSRRSIITFGEYLNASGLLPYSYYNTSHTIDLGTVTVTTNLRGAWASGTAYNQGDIVYVDGTVTGYSAVFQGRRSYWIAKQAHTAGATNQPILGTDSANTFLGPQVYWVMAWLELWLKPNVLAGTIYGDNSGGSTCTPDAVTSVTVCNDGALAPLAGPSITVGSSFTYNQGTRYAVGVLNGYLREGFVSMMPQTWGAPQGGQNTAPGCTRNAGSTWIECGAMPLTINRHIATAAMTN